MSIKTAQALDPTRGKYHSRSGAQTATTISGLRKSETEIQAINRRISDLGNKLKTVKSITGAIAIEKAIAKQKALLERCAPLPPKTAQPKTEPRIISPACTTNTATPSPTSFPRHSQNSPIVAWPKANNDHRSGSTTPVSSWPRPSQSLPVVQIQELAGDSVFLSKPPILTTYSESYDVPSSLQSPRFVQEKPTEPQTISPACTTITSTPSPTPSPRHSQNSPIVAWPKANNDHRSGSTTPVSPWPRPSQSPRFAQEKSPELQTISLACTTITSTPSPTPSPRHSPHSSQESLPLIYVDFSEELSDSSVVFSPSLSLPEPQKDVLVQVEDTAPYELTVTIPAKPPTPKELPQEPTFDDLLFGPDESSLPPTPRSVVSDDDSLADLVIDAYVDTADTVMQVYAVTMVDAAKRHRSTSYLQGHHPLYNEIYERQAVVKKGHDYLLKQTGLPEHASYRAAKSDLVRAQRDLARAYDAFDAFFAVVPTEVQKKFNPKRTIPKTPVLDQQVLDRFMHRIEVPNGTVRQDVRFQTYSTQPQELQQQTSSLQETLDSLPYQIESPTGDHPDVQRIVAARKQVGVMPQSYIDAYADLQTNAPNPYADERALNNYHYAFGEQQEACKNRVQELRELRTEMCQYITHDAYQGNPSPTIRTAMTELEATF